jgi:hypothetical protein
MLKKFSWPRFTMRVYETNQKANDIVTQVASPTKLNGNTVKLITDQPLSGEPILDFRNYSKKLADNYHQTISPKIFYWNIWRLGNRKDYFDGDDKKGA